jgi:hypothetical protein
MQQFFRLLIFLIQPYMFRAINSPILRSTFWLYIQLLVQCTDTAADRCHGWDGTDFRLNRGTGRQQYRCLIPKAVYTVKKCSWGWANLSPEKCRAELKRWINEKVVAYFWLFTSLLLCAQFMHQKFETYSHGTKNQETTVTSSAPPHSTMVEVWNLKSINTTELPKQ